MQEIRIVGGVTIELRKTKYLTLVFSIILCLTLFIFPVSYAQEEKIEWNRPIHFLGGQHTLVLMVDFTDVKFSSSIQKVEQIVKIVDNFIRTSSYGKAWLDYYIYPKVITLSKPMSYYGTPQAGAQRGDDDSRTLEFKAEVIRFVKEKSGIDITKFTHIIIVHAGGDEAVSSSPNDIWSHCMMSKALYFFIEKYGFDTIEQYLRKEGYGILVDILMHKKPDGEGHLLAGVETVAEIDMPSVMMHEFTHSLWIFDHYVYAKDGYSAGSEVGVWTNMDFGPFLDPPVDIDGWSKYLLGWVNAIEIEDDGEYVIHTLDKPDEPHALIIPVNDEEYYFIHARRPAGQDAALPGPGVLLFKVNKYRSRNVEGEPFMVSLFDANPETPPECGSLKKTAVRLCEGLDAPYYDENHYSGVWGSRLGRFEINLLNSETVTDEGYYIKVTEFDQVNGVAKIYVSLSGERTETTTETTVTSETTITKTVTGSYTETLYTTTISYETIEKTVVVTVTVKQSPPTENVTDYISIILIIVAVLVVFTLIIRGRRPPPPPPPPAPYYAGV